MNMNRILTLIFFLLFPSVCFGVYDWKLITKTENGDFYIDMNSFVIKDNKRFYLRLRNYKKKINMMKIQILFILKLILTNYKVDF